MSKEIELYVVIVTYNAEKWIDKCFSPFIYKPKNWEIIVIDNGSKDNTINILKEKYSFVNIVEEKENLGFGKANNIGMKMALEDNVKHVLLLNQDAWISVENIRKLIDLQDCYEEYYVISPMHYDAEGEELDFGFKKYIKRNSFLYRDIQENKVFKNLYSIEYCNAAIWLLSRKTLQEIGGFSPSFYHCGEDDNYIERIFYYNKRIGVAPHIKAFHDRKDRSKNDEFEQDTKNFLYRNFILKFLSNPKIAFFELSEVRVFFFFLLRSLYYLCFLGFKKFMACQEVIFIYLKNRELIKNNLKITKNKQANFL